MGCSVFVFCGILLLFFVAMPQYCTNENGCVIQGKSGKFREMHKKKWGKMMHVLKIITTFANEQLILIT